MQIIKTIFPLRAALAGLKQTRPSIGFVPTMGSLHEGHASLLKRCRKENDLSVLSIFVNPRQFGPQEDFASYPRDKKKDESLARREKIDILFYPSVEEMYPADFLTYVEVGRMSGVLCGQRRKGHFRGVATVVVKLLNIVSPDVLYLGQKDAQQTVIIHSMVKDLNIPVAVKVLPTIREKDGLAMSSRNRYLTENERREAPVLFQSLKQAKKLLQGGERNPQTITRGIADTIRASSSGRIEYVACVDADTLTPVSVIKGRALIALAVWFGKSRLIDNIVLTVK